MMTRANQPAVQILLYGPVARSDLPGLCARAREIVEQGDAGTLVCDARFLRPDAVSVDALAKLSLVAQEHGCRLELVHASADLLDIVGFMGLGDVLARD